MARTRKAERAQERKLDELFRRKHLIEAMEMVVDLGNEAADEFPTLESRFAQAAQRSGLEIEAIKAAWARL